MFTIAAIAMALVFWFFDSLVHYFIYLEPHFEIVPNDFNELWMRIVIVILVVFFGIFADFFTQKIMFKQKQLEVAGIYSSLIHTSSDILDNLLLQMQLFKVEALKSKDFDRDVIKYYDSAIEQASDLITTLSKVEKALDDSKFVDESGEHPAPGDSWS